MKYFQQMNAWKWMVLAMFVWHFATANRIIKVNKAFMNCLHELRTEPNSRVTIKRITLLSTIKRCSHRSEKVLKLINQESKSDTSINIVFAVNKIILKINDDQVELIRNNDKKTRNLLVGRQRVLGFSPSILQGMQSFFHTEPEPQHTKDPYSQPLQQPTDQTNTDPKQRKTKDLYGPGFIKLPSLSSTVRRMKSYFQTESTQQQTKEPYSQPLQQPTDQTNADTKQQKTKDLYGTRFIKLPSLSSIVSRVKSYFKSEPKQEQTKDQYGQPLQQPTNPYGQPLVQLPATARISGFILERVSKFIEYIWNYLKTALLRTTYNNGNLQGCLTFPTINFNNPLISVMFQQCQICGLANSFLRPMVKTIGPGYWNATSGIELGDMTLTFRSFHSFSSILPRIFSEIHFEAVQFHFNKMLLETSITVPFIPPMIPSSFKVFIKHLENFKVYFMTPNPSFKQRLIAISIEKSVQLLLNIILGILSRLLSVPNLLIK